MASRLGQPQAVRCCVGCTGPRNWDLFCAAGRGGCPTRSLGNTIWMYAGKCSPLVCALNTVFCIFWLCNFPGRPAFSYLPSMADLVLVETLITQGTSPIVSGWRQRVCMACYLGGLPRLPFYNYHQSMLRIQTLPMELEERQHRSPSNWDYPIQ